MRLQLATLILCVLLGACATTRRDLDRTVAEFDEAQYESARAWLIALEPDLASMSNQERTEFCYLRGMTELRLGARDEGLHWLRLAKASTVERDVTLRTEWQRVLDRSLAELSPETATHHARASLAQPETTSTR